MRGKAEAFTVADLLVGITPAYAGKRYTNMFLINRKQDHPRLCGEKIFSLFSHAPHTGSPPPMRGKAWAEAKVPADERITPAYAGKRPYGAAKNPAA